MLAVLNVARITAIAIASCGYLFGQLWADIFSPTLAIGATGAILAAIIDFSRSALPGAYAMGALVAFGAAAVAILDFTIHFEAFNLLFVTPYVAALFLVGASLVGKVKRKVAHAV